MDMLSIAKEYFQSLGVQFLVFSEPAPFPHFEQLDYRLREQLFPDFDYHSLYTVFEKYLKEGTLYLLEDEFHLHYAVLRLPQNLQSKLGVFLLHAGPVIFHPMRMGDFLSLIEDFKISPELQSDMQEFYNRIPIPGSFDTWSATATFFFSKIAGYPLDSIVMRYKDLPFYAHLYQHLSVNYTVPTKSNLAIKAIEERYRIEEELMNAVSVGNTEAALSLLIQFHQYKLLPRTADPVRNKKNILIVLSTLCRKAAQRGLVHPLHIDSLSTQIAIQLESMTSLSALDAFTPSIVRKYCLLVKNYSRRSYSFLVQTCLDYIDFHYAENLSLDSLARMCSVTNSYLSALFKKEVFMTVTDYINSTRIHQSLILLNTTTLSIQEIAVQCGFADSNYYARTFKKLLGQSPKGYRDAIRIHLKNK